jgi:hypothetical protein
MKILTPEDAAARHAAEFMARIPRRMRGLFTLDVAITYRMPYGFAGDVTRPGAPSSIEPQAYGATAFAGYGLPLKLSGNTVIPIAAQNDVVYGFLVRPFPITGANASDPLGTSVPPTTGVANILRRGYMAVKVQLGGATAALGGALFLRYQNPVGTTQIVGGVEGATSGNNYQLTSTYVVGGAAAPTFMGVVDTNNVAEIGFNI